MKSFALGVLFLVVGIGLCVSSLAVLIEASIVHLTLNRHTELSNAKSQVNGFVEYRFLGVPIYWMTLQDVKAVERRELTTGVRAASVDTKRKRKLERLVFIDSRNAIIAWGERDSLVNAIETLKPFLEGDEKHYVYVENRTGHPWDIFKDKVIKLVFAITLVGGGLICIWGGGRQLGKCMSFRKKPEPSAS